MSRLACCLSIPAIFVGTIGCSGLEAVGALAGEGAEAVKEANARAQRGHLIVRDAEVSNTEPEVRGVGLFSEFAAGIRFPNGAPTPTPAPMDLVITSDRPSDIRILEDGAQFDTEVAFSVVASEPGRHNLHLQASNTASGTYSFDVCDIDSCSFRIRSLPSDPPFESGEHVVYFEGQADWLWTSCFPAADCDADVSPAVSLRGLLPLEYEGPTGETAHFAAGFARVQPGILRDESGNYFLSLESATVAEVSKLRLHPDTATPINIPTSGRTIRVQALTAAGDVIYGKRDYVLDVTGADLAVSHSNAYDDALSLSPLEDGESQVLVALGRAVLTIDVVTEL